MISSYEDESSSATYPLLTICNLNPIKGSTINSNSQNPIFGQKSGIDYETLVDSLNGQHQSQQSSKSDIIQQPVLSLMDNSKHELSSMLIHCSVREKKCSHYDFVKTIHPLGTCYQYNKTVNEKDDISLVLDPEPTEYLIPNRGLVGFQIFFSSPHDLVPGPNVNSFYAGLKFHSIVTLNCLKKVYNDDCLSGSERRRCLQNCIDEQMKRKCHCQLSDLNSESCTLLNVIQCQDNLFNIMGSINYSTCNCKRSCHSEEYSVESFVQGLKSPFNQVNIDSNLKRDTKLFNKIKKGILIQKWSYLREINRVAFEEARGLTTLLADLISFIGKVDRFSNQLKMEKEANKMVLDLSKRSKEKFTSSDCLEPEELDSRLETLIRSLNRTFTSFQDSFLSQRKMNQDDGIKNLHVIIVNWLFDHEINKKFTSLSQTMILNEVISDLTVLDHRNKASTCSISALKQIDNNKDSLGPSSMNKFDTNEFLLTLMYAEDRFVRLNESILRIQSQHWSTFEKIPEELNLQNYNRANVEMGHVSFNIKLSGSGNRILRLESVQNIFSMPAAFLDLFVHGLILLALTYIIIAKYSFIFRGPIPDQQTYPMGLQQKDVIEEARHYYKQTHGSLLSPCDDNNDGQYSFLVGDRLAKLHYPHNRQTQNTFSIPGTEPMMRSNYLSFKENMGM